MNQGCFLKVRSRGSQDGVKKQARKFRWFKYILQPQQIQLMSTEDNGSLVFYKVKNIFFQEDLNEQQIASIIRDSPIKVIDMILTKITDFYNHKVEDIVETIQEEKQSLVNQLIENQEKLQHSLDDNDFFKLMIDKLEEEKKDVEIRLNQSQSQIQKTSQECELIAGENTKIKYSVIELYEANQQLQAENSQLIDNTLFLQRQLQAYKHHSNQLKHDYNELYLSRKDLEDQLSNLDDQLTRLKEQNQNLSQKLNSKETFIASFINQYNKIHFFQHRDSYYESQKKMSSLFEGSHQFKGYIFNQFDKDSVIIEQISKNDNSSELDEIQIDSKFACVSATAEKPKSLTSKAKLCQSEQKSSKSPRQELQDKEGSINNKNILKYSFNTRIDNLIEKENQRFGSLNKAISSENYHLTQHSAKPIEVQGSKFSLQEVLRKKVLQKNIKINKLENELFILKAQYIEQREKTTEMQGEYQILIEELKDKLQSQRTQFSKLYQKYILNNSENQVYQEKIVELEEQLKKNEDEHSYYCDQLRQKCKAYIIKRIDEVQQQYQQLLAHRKSPEGSPYSVQQVSEQDEEDGAYEGSVDQGSLKLGSVEEVDSPDEKKYQSSDSYSYRHLSNHHINSLHLNLQFSRTQNITTEKEMTDQMYIKDNFEIQSDLGAFTQRLKKQQADHKERGNFTSREGKRLSSHHEIGQYIQHLSIKSKDIDYHIKGYPANLTFIKVDPIRIDPITKQSVISTDEQREAGRKPLDLQLKVVDFHVVLQPRKELRISQTMSYCLQKKEVYEDRKYMIHAFHIFQSGSTLNTTQKINRSWLRLDCNSFLLNTDQKKEQEHNNTFILEQEEDEHRKEIIIPFGLGTQERTQEYYHVVQDIYEQSTYQINQEKQQENKEQLVQNIVNEVVAEKKLEKDQRQMNSISKQISKLILDINISINEQQQVRKGQNNNTKEQQRNSKSCCDVEEHKKDQIKKYSSKHVIDEDIPEFIRKKINASVWKQLSIFLNKNKLSLRTQSSQTETNILDCIIGPKKICIFVGEKNSQQYVFVMNEKRLFCLNDFTFIKGQHTKVIQGKALIFGQSQVIMTTDHKLTVNREGRLNKLEGNISDGEWKIKQFVPCEYSVLN